MISAHILQTGAVWHENPRATVNQPTFVATAVLPHSMTQWTHADSELPVDVSSCNMKTAVRRLRSWFILNRCKNNHWNRWESPLNTGHRRTSHNSRIHLCLFIGCRLGKKNTHNLRCYYKRHKTNWNQNLWNWWNSWFAIISLLLTALSKKCPNVYKNHYTIP